MGGQSSSTQTQQSQTDPWAAAQPMLKNILGQLQGGLGNTGLTGQETGALNSVEANAAGGNPFAGQIGANATSLLNGGGAMNQAGNVNQNYLDYRNATQPLASNTNYDPYSTPGMKDMLATMTSDITQGVNGQFAAAGRDFSGANSQALGRGLTQGLAPTLVSAFNANRDAQQGAAGNLYSAGNANAGLLSGFQQQAMQNGQAGTQAANDALSAGNYGNNQILAAEAQRRGIPVQALGLLAQIGIPIAGLGGTTSGTTQGTAQMSGADQFNKILSGVGSLIPKGPMNFSFTG